MNRALLLTTVALAIVLGACGDDDTESYTGEPSGRIVFTTDRDGNEELYAIGVDGSGAVNLTNSPARDSAPNVNRAGDRIAFISARTGAEDVWIMAADGTGAVALTNDPASDSSPVWSLDGLMVAHYSARDQLKGYLWVTQVADGSAGPLLDSDDSAGADEECSGGEPGDWLDDETVIYQGSYRELLTTGICSVKLSGAERTAIYGKSGSVALEPDLSPDGRKIAFMSNEPGNMDVYVMNADGTGEERLTSDPGIDGWPAWSPDGQWLAFSSERTGNAEIYLMRPDGSDVRQVTSSDAADTLPTWLP
ncbi:MAG: hypothetical protein WD904_05105 [Dehalococcoidia bacterium]